MWHHTGACDTTQARVRKRNRYYDFMKNCAFETKAEPVSSKENISDGPSRGKDELIKNLGFEIDEAKLPSAAELFNASRAWKAAQSLRWPPVKADRPHITRRVCR